MGPITIGYRNARVCRHGNGTRNTRNNLEWNSCLRKSTGFLTATSENEWITAFETAYVLALSRLLDHEPVYVFLLQVFVAVRLSNIDDFGIGPGFFKQVQIDEPVVKYNVGISQAQQAADSDEIRISRPRADDVDNSRMVHDSMIS
jgi:hypothetical protein